MLVHASQLDEREIKAVPTIFQEHIDGVRHVRAVVLGEEVTWIEFSSTDLDWRRNVPERMQANHGDKVACSQLVALCKSLELRMGIADLKYRADGELIFLELNPQGQFLYAERFLPFSLADRFAEFLLSLS